MTNFWTSCGPTCSIRRLPNVGKMCSRNVNASLAVVDFRLVRSASTHASAPDPCDESVVATRFEGTPVGAPANLPARRLQADYTVVMTTPVSIRFRRPEVVERLKAEAGARHLSSSALAEELIEEGLRTRRHPLVVFRDGPSGRRAGLVGGPDVWEVIGGLVGGDIPAEARIERAVDVFGLTPKQVGAALDYYADFTTEIDGEIAANLAAADEAEAVWRRRQDLLAR
jgi:hypothetical protein